MKVISSKHSNLPLVVHVIHALGTGGLENGLVNIINRTPKGTYRHAIVCLTQAHDFKNRLNSKEIPIVELHKKPGNDISVYLRMWSALRRLKASIVHTRNLTALEMQLVASLFPGVRRVHGEHGRDIYDLYGSNKKYNLLRKAIRPLVHHYITVSQDLKHWLEKTVSVNPKRISQIYNGVERSLFFPGPKRNSGVLPRGFLPEDGILFGAVGRLAEVKGHSILVDAFGLLLEKHPETRSSVRLLIVGDGPVSAAIHESVESKNIGDCVWLPGDRSDVPELLRAMDVFVLPSLGEGVSNTLLEAMASGLPVVATRVGGNPELIDKLNGLLVEPGDAAKLMQGMETLLLDSDLRKQMGKASLEKIDEFFQWDKTVAEYLQVYDAVLNRNVGLGTD